MKTALALSIIALSAPALADDTPPPNTELYACESNEPLWDIIAINVKDLSVISLSGMTQDPTTTAEPVGGVRHNDYHVDAQSFEIGPTDPRDATRTDAFGIAHDSSGSRIYYAQWHTVRNGVSTLKFGDHTTTAYLYKQTAAQARTNRPGRRRTVQLHRAVQLFGPPVDGGLARRWHPTEVRLPAGGRSALPWYP